MNPKEKPPAPPSELPTLSSFLLSDVKQMRPEAWGRLVSTFGPIVYRWCRSSGVSQDDAADVVQEVFATVARGIVSFERQKEEGSFRAWLATITRSRVRDFFRRKSKGGDAAIGGTAALQRFQAEPLQNPAPLESTIDSTNMRNEILKSVTESVRAEFEAQTWQAFLLTTVEDKPASAVAEQLGLSVASVYQAKSRVLKKLRQRMSEIPD